MQLKSYFVDQCTANDRRCVIDNGHIEATGCVVPQSRFPCISFLFLANDWCLGGHFKFITKHKNVLLITLFTGSGMSVQKCDWSFIFFYLTTIYHSEQLHSSNDATVFDSS